MRKHIAANHFISQTSSFNIYGKSQNIHGSSLLKASKIKCPSILSIHSQSIDWYLITIQLTSWLTLNRHSINSELIVSQASTNSYTCMHWSKINRLWIDCWLRCRSRVLIDTRLWIKSFSKRVCRVHFLYLEKQLARLHCHLFIPADSRGQMIQKLTCTWHKHKNKQKGQENAEELQPKITSQWNNLSESIKIKLQNL